MNIKTLRGRLRTANVTKNINFALGSIVEYINHPSNDIFDTWWLEKKINEALLAKEQLELLLDTADLDYEDLLHHCKTTLNEDSEESESSEEGFRPGALEHYNKRMNALVKELAAISKQIVDLTKSTDQT